MPAHKKKTPLKYCKQCGKKLERKRLPNGDLEYLIHFKRRKYCGRICMAIALDNYPVKKNPKWATAHYHARKLCPKGPCAICGTTNGRDVHHKNHDWRDNSLENLQRLCRSCHNKIHRTPAFGVV